MSGAIKMEGFQPSNNGGGGHPSSPQRPLLNRPFSDGSMTVDSSILSSIMNTSQPFSFGPSSLPNQSQSNNPFDYGMVSPHSPVLDLPTGTSPHGFQPHAMFGHLNFGAENREPPVVASSMDSNNNGNNGSSNNNGNSRTDNRSRSQSSSRSSNIGKAPSARARSGRKLSMNDVRPTMQPPRGRTIAPPRSMSFQTDVKPTASSIMALGRTNSITSPQEMTFEQQYGIAIPNSDYGGQSMWGGGSAPSVLPEGMASYGASVEVNGLESPVTPAQTSATLLGDESRKQRRRECHNQVEKRRREHINAMIEELNKLLPSKFKMPDPDMAIEDDDEDDANTQESPVKKKKSKRTASTSKQQKESAQCKGRILSDSVHYIRDLQSINEQQSTRIQYLESLLMTGGNQSLQQSWAASQNAEQHPSELAYGQDQLEAMRATPEPDNLVPMPQSGWSGFNNLVFETSPTEASSGNDIQRSTPQSSDSPETDTKDPVVWGLVDFADEQRDSVDLRLRKDSQHELQSSLSNMEIDVGPDGRRPWSNF